MSAIHALTLEYLNLKTRETATRHAWRASNGSIRLSQLRDPGNSRLVALKTPAGERLTIRAPRMDHQRLERALDHLFDGRADAARSLLGCF